MPKSDEKKTLAETSEELVDFAEELEEISEKSKKKEKQLQKVRKKETKKKERKKREKRRGRKKKKEEQKITEEKPSEVELNAYNILFDEVIGFLNQLKHMSLKELKQHLILLDGKLLWMEKQSELELITSEETDDMIDLEMEMLEMGLELDSAEEVKASHSGAPGVIDLEQMKETIHQQETFRESIMNLVQEIEEDPIEEPVEDLMSKFLLYDLRAFLEKAINKVFTLEGKINQLVEKKAEQKEIDKLHQEQQRATQSYLKDIIKKLKKEKPKMILSEEKITQFKKLTNEQVAELKAKEEKQFDEMVEDLLK